MVVVGVVLSICFRGPSFLLALIFSFFAASLAFAHLASTAFRALSLRCSGVSLAARAGPPLRPRETAAEFFLTIFELYLSDREESLVNGGP